MAKNRDEKVYLDQAGYDQYLAEIEQLKEDLRQNSFNKSSAHESAVGDGWHDNYAFEEAKRQELMIIATIEAKLAGLKNIVIVEKGEQDDLVDLGDTVTVDMAFGDEQPDAYTFKLVGASNPKPGEEVSINSNLGKGVYKQKVGYSNQYPSPADKNTIIKFSITNLVKKGTIEKTEEDTIGGRTR